MHNFSASEGCLWYTNGFQRVRHLGCSRGGVGGVWRLAADSIGHAGVSLEGSERPRRLLAMEGID